MPNAYSQNWNLDSLFSGGSHSPDLQKALKGLKNQIENMQESFSTLSLKFAIASLQELDRDCQELESFIACLLSQNVEDKRAIQLQSEIVSLKANYENLSVRLDEALHTLSEADFAQLVEDPSLSSVTFNLQERRKWAKNKLPVEQEQLVNQLWIDGYQGWNDLYGTLMGSIRIPLPDQTNVQVLSVGQAENRLSHPDRKVRQALFQQWEQTWTEQEETFAQILNHLAGFRLRLYQARKWSSILEDPLFCNRMQEKTLTVMWETIQGYKIYLQQYLHKKASLLKLPRLAWFDVESPLFADSSAFISFPEAAEMIVQQFSTFNPNMGSFAKKAFQERWIEVEDRTGKRPGGFCAQFPRSQQSRIFMTYSGTMTNVFTLAHELGHAYHNEIIHSLPRFAQHYRMNVAETASTLAEMVTIDSMVEQARNIEVKKALLDYKVQRSVLFLMNIHARFLFEMRFYEERKKGFVLASDLNALMEEAQKEAFCYSLGEWHPHFWVAKQHFYATGVPFYHFPYTFGYLFSLGIYAHLRERGKEGYLAYEALLRDTGRMMTEELALDHLQVDLTLSPFWEKALEQIKKDVQNALSIMS